jgi:Mn2+-dependent serine/threonine protein kinase
LEIKKIEPIKKGAEAEIWKGFWFDLVSIFKIRVPKAWRHPLLDQKIRTSRTIKEARIIYSAMENSVRVPYIYDVDPENALIVMEFIEGNILKEVFKSNYKDFSKEIGRIIGKLHSSNIVHGDVTLSNFILSGNEICIIDFGLADFSNRDEDRGIDLHLFLRNLESSFSSIAKECFNYFIEGYSEFFENYDEILEKLDEIRKRGRYVEERRKIKTF